jgi:hypothetical protein
MKMIEQTPTNQKNADLAKMSQEELIAEQARLRRSQGGNKNEETWSPELYERLQEVEKILKTGKATELAADDPDADLQSMSIEQLLAEEARLRRSQGNNPKEEAWTPKLHARLQKLLVIKQSLS